MIKKILQSNIKKSILISLFLLVGLFVVIKILIAWSHGYSMREMDWDGDGRTTIFEIYEASNIETRNVKIDGQKCVEFFTLKDAYPLKTLCKLDKNFKPNEVGARQKKIGNLNCKESFVLKNNRTIEINCHPDIT